MAQIGAVIGRGFSYPLIRAVAKMDDATLQTALERLAEADILLVEGLPPESDYRFKHALIQDAAYENLLKSRRQVLHRRVAEALLDKLAATAEAEPELLAHHFTQAGRIESAIEWWNKAGQRSLERSALVEAAEQLTRALSHIETLPATPALRREQINLQVALITPLIHVKGYAAPETKAATERARLLIEQAETLGEGPEDPLLLFSVLYGVSIANLAAFNGDALRELAKQFLALAGRQGATIPLMIGHRLLGHSLLMTGDIAKGLTHYNTAISLYDPSEHRPLATRFGQDNLVSIMTFRSFGLWAQGYPEAALADADHVLKHAREINHAASLMFALSIPSLTYTYSGNYAAAGAHAEEVIALANDKGTVAWKGFGLMNQGWLMVLTGRAADAIDRLTSGIDTWRSTGSTIFVPIYLSYLARAHAELDQFDQASCCINETMTLIETTNQRFWEADTYLVAGEIALKSPDLDYTKAEAYFKHALTVARGQQAKSWELRAAMSFARLWRDQGKVQQAREQLAPVYGWFTEGFDTRDLKEAKALLDELAA